VRRVLSDEAHWEAADGLIWTHFDDSDDRVVFHPQSGDVHLVSAAAYLLWTLLAEHTGSTLAQLTDSLAAALDRPGDAQLGAATSEALTFMDRTGLIRPRSR
jgi:PqqD family protein of HPr-rel-A system